MSFDLDTLKFWDDRIVELVERYQLNCYPQEFEVCDHYDMLGYMAYSGMPAHYPHWSYGKSYEKQKTMYDYGVSGLPYEMVINSNPCLAYLMRDNSLLLQILTIAHVYGHNDFFANNFTFTSGTEAKYSIERFKNNANRIREYTEDPSIGVEAVEETLNHAHSLQFQRSPNLAIKELSYREYEEWQIDKLSPKPDPYKDIHPKREEVTPQFDKLPPQPERNILLFLAKYSPSLAPWQRDILKIVDQQSQYFIPQIETKIMNEGWASYWHYKILNNLDLPDGLRIEFMVKHNQVLRPHPGSINPYHLGFKMFLDIERRWNEGDTRMEFSDSSKKKTWTPEDGGENDSPGRKKIFQIRESDRDASFIRRFLTPELIRELNLFQHEQRGNDRVVTKVADDENCEEIKNTLARSVGVSSFPVIHIIDADFGKNRTLLLKHEFDGRELLLEYSEHTLKHVSALWGRDVSLETQLNGKSCLLHMRDGKMKIEKQDKKKSES